MRLDHGRIIIDFKELPKLEQIRLLKGVMFDSASINMELVEACLTHIALSDESIYQKLFQSYLDVLNTEQKVLSSELFKHIFQGVKREIIAAEEQLSLDQFEVLYNLLCYKIRMKDVKFVDDVIDWLNEQQLLDTFGAHLLSDKHEYNFLISFEVTQNNREKISLLLAHGIATIKSNTFGRGQKFYRFEPLEIAVEHKNKDVFVLLLDYYEKTYKGHNLLGNQGIDQLSCAPLSLKVNYLQKAIESDAYDIAEYLVKEKKVNLNYVTAYYQGAWHANSYTYKDGKDISISHLMAMKCLLQIAALHDRRAIFKLILTDPSTKLLHYFTEALLTTGNESYDRMIEFEAAERLVTYYQQEVAKRADDDYQTSFTIFDHTFNFGYSAGEKKIAAAALFQVIKAADEHDQVDRTPLSKHAGAVKNGRLGEAYKLFCNAKGLKPSDIPKQQKSLIV